MGMWSSSTLNPSVWVQVSSMQSAHINAKFLLHAIFPMFDSSPAFHFYTSMSGLSAPHNSLQQSQPRRSHEQCDHRARHCQPRPPPFQHHWARLKIVLRHNVKIRQINVNPSLDCNWLIVAAFRFGCIIILRHSPVRQWKTACISVQTTESCVISIITFRSTPHEWGAQNLKYDKYDKGHQAASKAFINLWISVIFHKIVRPGRGLLPASPRQSRPVEPWSRSPPVQRSLGQDALDMLRHASTSSMFQRG